MGILVGDLLGCVVYASVVGLKMVLFHYGINGIVAELEFSLRRRLLICVTPTQMKMNGFQVSKMSQLGYGFDHQRVGCTRRIKGYFQKI